MTDLSNLFLAFNYVTFLFQCTGVTIQIDIFYDKEILEVNSIHPIRCKL